MNSAEEPVEGRHIWLVERLMRDRSLATNQVATELGVSVDTVRRDLRLLHEQGKLRRVHGGALPASRLPDSYSGRSLASEPEAASVVSAIAERFRAGQVIGLDGGSTCAQVAQQIPSTLAVTIVTNNPAVAVALVDHQAATVTLLGGFVDLRWLATCGAETVDGWRRHRLDVAVVGVCGFDANNGLTTNSPNEVSTKQALIESAAEVVVPLQHDKIGTAAPFVVAGIDCVDVVVVPPGLGASSSAAWKDSDFELVDAGGPN